ncbi:MAG TPA: cobaltochelatase subunit CobN [Pyrinomonadaceae bacterium]|nr:cobaltochelatase subunit CobN [Pyrinomonadaceae bacterium]
MTNSNASPRLTSAERDRRVLDLYEQLLEIEQRLIPTGLHVLGRPSQPHERADMLRMIASFERPEASARALTSLVAEGLELPDYNSSFESASLEAREKVETIVTSAIEEFVNNGAAAAASLLHSKAKVSQDDSRPVFSLLESISEQLQVNTEMESFLAALRGDYIPSGPGADIVQNPAILPTGRNTHAINPYGVPSTVAFSRARVVADSLLERYVSEQGRYPNAIGLVLWGLDNIKTQGEGVAQALWLLGVRPVRDALNRVTEVTPIPLADLRRPRMDVVMTVSGIFRDLFSPTIQLLDKAVRTVAQLDEPLEMNYVRRNVLDQSCAAHCEVDDAAVRVFSNAPGNYGTNVNFMVMDSEWEREDSLGDLFVTRKCFAYGRDSKGLVIDGREARVAMDRALARVEATYQNIDTFEIGITDVDHYFEYLGGISRAVEKRAGARPSIYLSDSLSEAVKIRTLEETVRLETRAKTLNPKWYEGMLNHGFRGVAEIENHVSNTFGWSATADAVDDWIYTGVAETFLLDSRMLERLQALNPHSAHVLVGRLLEAHGRGYWEADPKLMTRLNEIAGELEDQLEGIR